MPPHRTLGFNPQVTVDDALLIAEYISDQQLSYEDAARKLRNDVSLLRRALSAKGKARMGELGTFSMNIKGEILFTPDPNGIDDPYNFGFEPLVMPLLSECDKKEIVIKRRTFRKYVSIAAAIIVGLFLIIPVGNSLQETSMQAGISIKKSTPTQTAEVNAVVSQKTTTEPSCVIAPVEETVTKNVITPEYAAELEVTEEKAKETVDNAVAQDIASPRFSIIVASCPTAENAQQAISELSTILKHDYSVINLSRRHRIAHSTYGSNSEAMVAIEKVKETFPNAWILEH